MCEPAASACDRKLRVCAKLFCAATKFSCEGNRLTLGVRYYAFGESY
jgi:hypothetical protein